MARKVALKAASEPAAPVAAESPAESAETVATPRLAAGAEGGSVGNPAPSGSKSCGETEHVKACRCMLFGEMPVI